MVIFGNLIRELYPESLRLEILRSLISCGFIQLLLNDTRLLKRRKKVYTSIIRGGYKVLSYSYVYILYFREQKFTAPLQESHNILKFFSNSNNKNDANLLSRIDRFAM